MTVAFAYDTTTDGRVREVPALDTAGGEATPGIEGADAGDRRQARLERQLDRLARLAEIGMELAEGLARKAAGSEAEAAAPGFERDVCLAFTRIARAIRQINAQEQEILGLSEQVRRETRQARADAEEMAAEERKAAVRRQVLGTVRDLLDVEDDIDLEARDDLLADLGRDYDDYYDLYRGSFDEIVGRVCRDLGIAEVRAARASRRPARARGAKPAVGRGARSASGQARRARGRDPP